MEQPTVTVDTVKTVLGKVYNQFGFETSGLAERFADLLNDPAKSVTDDDASEAAAAIRKTLWSYYSGGGASASATCDLFYTLGRQDELDWIEDQVPGYRFDG